MVIESFTTARAYGVEERLLPRFTTPFPASMGETGRLFFFSSA